jgi:hypothetical protein
LARATTSGSKSIGACPVQLISCAVLPASASLAGGARKVGVDRHARGVTAAQDLDRHRPRLLVAQELAVAQHVRRDERPGSVSLIRPRFSGRTRRKRF